MNTELLLKVKEAIINHPRKFNMDEFKCGSAMCIGGWACKLAYKKLPLIGVWNMSQDALGITSAQSEKLFLVDRWPAKFRDGFYDLSKEEQAKTAADRIDYFIKRKV